MIINNQHGSKKQQGVVLFIALIALVVMSLAAVALIRSVDTNSMIAGNLAFKQSATISADSGVESAITWLSANATTLESDNTTSGYYATCSTFDASTDKACGATNLTTTSWVAGTNSRFAAGTGITNGVDLSGNTIQYIVQRMCTATGAPSTANCLYGAVATPANGMGVVDAPQAGAPTTSVPSPAYRVTAKVTGPKNTVSYIQAYIY